MVAAAAVSGLPLAAIAVACIALIAAGPALAAGKEDRVFTVGNYPVEARAANAVTAKERAIADGQTAAFRSLLKRIVPVSSYNRIAKLRVDRPTDLVEGFSVRSERNSSTEYIASYDFAFAPEAVRRILDRENIPFLDRQAPQITIVPVYRAPAGAPEGYADVTGSDAWLYAWKGLDLANTLTPATLLPLKREIHPDTVKAMVDGDQAALRILASEYKSETVLLAVLDPDLKQKRLVVTLAGRDAVASFKLSRRYRLDDLAYTAELAAVISLGILEGRWKAINVRGEGGSVVRGGGIAAQPDPMPRPGEAFGGSGSGSGAGTTGGDLRIAVEFRSMAEWQQISRTLAQVPEIADLDVIGLSARGARVSLRYPGGAQSLALVLAQQGLILRSGSGGWVLTQR